MSEPVLAVANFFIKKAADSGDPITPMKLLKLVYIAHGWHLALTGEPLIDEDVEAWKYGPVIPSLYRRYRDYGNSPIGADGVSGYVGFSNELRIAPFLERIWEVYKDYTAIQLSSMTHTSDTPWYHIWHGKGGRHYLGANIPNDLIRTHYAKKATR